MLDQIMGEGNTEEESKKQTPILMEAERQLTTW